MMMLWLLIQFYYFFILLLYCIGHTETRDRGSGELSRATDLNNTISNEGSFPSFGVCYIGYE